jgi:hypothetical protein
MVNTKNLIGEKFGELTVKCRLQNEKGRSSWYCICSCGGFKIIDSKALVTGKTASCGCLRSTHGLSKSHPLYQIWLNIRDRCNNPRNKRYRHYGGKGVQVCARWDDFTLFIADMGPRPPHTSVDRVNNDGNYEPSNCRWATALEQAQHTSRSRLLTAAGRTMIMSDWARELGINPAVIVGRLQRGWTEENACTLPRQHRWSRR